MRDAPKFLSSLFSTFIDSVPRQDGDEVDLCIPTESEGLVVAVVPPLGSGNSIMFTPVPGISPEQCRALRRWDVALRAVHARLGMDAVAAGAGAPAAQEWGTPPTNLQRVRRWCLAISPSSGAMPRMETELEGESVAASIGLVAVFQPPAPRNLTQAERAWFGRVLALSEERMAGCAPHPGEGQRAVAEYARLHGFPLGGVDCRVIVSPDGGHLYIQRTDGEGGDLVLLR